LLGVKILSSLLSTFSVIVTNIEESSSIVISLALFKRPNWVAEKTP
jgi:hypothetical protein